MVTFTHGCHAENGPGNLASNPNGRISAGHLHLQEEGPAEGPNVDVLKDTCIDRI